MTDMIRMWLRIEIGRLRGIRAVVAGLACLTVGAAWILGPVAPAVAPAGGGGVGGRVRAAEARRVREEALERTLGAVRGIRRALLTVAPDGSAAVVNVLPDPDSVLAIECRAVIVRLVCDAFPAVPPRRVVIVEDGGRTAVGGR